MKFDPLWLVPVTREKIPLGFSKEDVIEKLDSHVEWGTFLALELARAPSGRLVGKRLGEVYTIARSIRYQNIYQPYARFRIDPVANGSVIFLTFYAPFSILFLLLCALLSYSAMEAVGFLALLVFVSLIHLAGVLLFFWEKQKILRILRQTLGE